MNPATLHALLEAYGLDEAARAALVALALTPTEIATLQQALDTALTRHPDTHPSLHSRRETFRNTLLELCTWDFSPGWARRLAALWNDIAGSRAEPEWFCEVAAALCAALTQLRPAATAALVACQRLLFLLTATLLREGRERADAHRSLALASDEATGLYRSAQALSQMQSWIAARAPAGFAVVVLRIVIGPVLLRISAGLTRALLRQITARIARVLRAQDSLFSGGEWEWILLLPGLDNEAALAPGVARLLHVFDVPFDVFGREYRLNAAAGAAFYPSGGLEADALLRSARIALHEATRAGTHYDFFRSEMDHSAARYAAIEHGFLEALRHDKLELYLQPQIDTRDGTCRHAEALLRWGHAAGQTVAPQFIVEMAEEAGARHSFSRWLVTRAVRTLAELARRGLDIGLSINLTANDLADPELPDAISQACSLWRVRGMQLTIELTEAAIIPNDRHSVEALTRLRELGCRLSVDDFGTGYSSMAYLRQLPLNELKIDQLFVRRMSASSEDREIVRSMLQLAHGLHLDVVAEGVEDEATVSLLREYGCERMQGFLFGPPMPLPAFLAWQQARAE